MYSWQKSPGGRKSSSERLFGVGWGTMLTSAIILGCIAFSFVLQQREKAPVQEPSFDSEMKPVRRKGETREEPKSSSLEFAPSWGNIKQPFKSFAEQKKQPPEKRPAPESTQAFTLPSTTPIVQEPKKKRKIQYPKEAGGTGGGSGGSALGTGAAQKAQNKPKKDEKPAYPFGSREVDAYRTDVSHAHGGGAAHGHDSVGRATSGPGHRHKYRVKIPIIPGVSDFTGSIKIQNVNVYRLQEIVEELQAESLRTGKPIFISGEQARSIAKEVGLAYTGEDSQF